MNYDGRKTGGLCKLSPERRREIARMGNAAMRARNLQHRFTREEAAEAGRKGGLTRKRERRDAL